MNRRFASCTLLFGAAVCLSACTSVEQAFDPAAKRHGIDFDADYALSQLYSQVKGSRELLGKARGYLVFPKVISAGLVLGGSHGEGALRRPGESSAYYKLSSGSVGLSVGVESKAVFVVFLTEDTLQKFLASDGWTAGADASVALPTAGADGSIDTSTAHSSVVGFVLSNGGLMLNLSFEGAKVSKLGL